MIDFPLSFYPVRVNIYHFLPCSFLQSVDNLSHAIKNKKKFVFEIWLQRAAASLRLITIICCVFTARPQSPEAINLPSACASFKAHLKLQTHTRASARWVNRSDLTPTCALQHRLEYPDTEFENQPLHRILPPDLNSNLLPCWAKTNWPLADKLDSVSRTFARWPWTP